MASIKCGNCGNSHESVEAVRKCYGQQQRPSKVQGDIRGGNGSEADKATPKQQAFIASLRSERGLDELPFAGTKKQASDEIERLLAMPKPKATSTSPAPSQYPDVAQGYYAIEVDGTLKFYRVDRPTEGRWAGYTFVKVQASDDLFPVRGTAAKAVLEAIAVDPKAATLRYGHEIGRCGKCGRTLTDEDSRAAGIGPVCAGKMGW